MNIPFIKAHGARNDFLLTWREHSPQAEAHRGSSPSRFAIATPASAPMAGCSSQRADGDACAKSSCGIPMAAAVKSPATARAAPRRLLVEALPPDQDVSASATGAGLKHLRLLERTRPLSFSK